MKQKIRKRIKLIKFIVFAFGFLFFFALFLGLNNTNNTDKNAKEDALEEVSPILPQELSIEEKDYKIYTYSNPEIIYVEKTADSQELKSFTVSAPNPSDYASTTQRNVANNSTDNSNGDSSDNSNGGTVDPQVSELYIPQAFEDRASPTSLRAFQPSQSTQPKTPQNIVKSALNTIKANNNNNKQQTQQSHIQKGRNSGIFVGNTHSTVGIGQGNGGILDNLTNQLSDSLGNFQNIGQRSVYDAQNSQSQKIDFLNAQQNSNQNYSLEDEGSFYGENEDIIVIAGTIIPVIMVTAINSDLPGMISARITEDVYDSLYGTKIIIPKGSMVIGSYDSSLSWGQKRLLVVWQRLSRPDGLTLDLEAMQGIDSQGASGIQGKTKTYIGAGIASAILSSSFTLGFNYTSYNARLADETGSLGEAVDGAGNSLNDTMKNLSNKLLNRQPTINIKPGTKGHIFVNKEFKFQNSKLQGAKNEKNYWYYTIDIFVCTFTVGKHRRYDRLL